MSNESNIPAESGTPGEADPIADPGLPAHTWRPTDVDERAEKRAERQVVGLFVFAMVCAVLFVVAYFAFDVGENPTVILGLGASTVGLGLTLGLGLLCIGIGIIQWARKLMSDVEISELRHPATSSADDREATLAALKTGLAESGIGRRPMIRNSLLGAVGLMGVPAIVLFRDLGPLPGDKLEKTVWAKGTRVVRDVIGTPIKPSEVQVGDLFNCEPEGLVPLHGEGEREGVKYYEGSELLAEKAKAAIVLHRMEPKENTPWKGRENWAYEGIVAYSKICTHVGCPISLNEQQTHHLLCPCHQSTFDLSDNGIVVFGPAARALPQLPLALDDEGYLVAQSDFTEPVGPSYWERG